jgi:UDP-glucose 4-epimerase
MIIVTGGAGFVGSHLVDKLIKNGKKVLVIDDFSTGKRKNLNNKARVWQDKIQNCRADKLSWGTDMVDEPVELIFHLAALARIQPSFEAPQATYDANSTGTIAALEMARHYKARLIYSGSSTADSDVFLNPYAYTKLLGEQHCKLYNKHYGVEGAVARFYNVYGPRQIEKGPFSTVIGIFERQWREGKALTVTGDGKQRRDFTHVNDIVNGLIALSKENWNFCMFPLGRGKNFSINEVAGMFKSPIEYISARPGEARHTQASIKGTTRATEWKPEHNLEDYIAGVIGEQ